MSLLDGLTLKTRERAARIVFPEGNDHRIIEAAKELSAKCIADVIVLGTGDAPEGCLIENPVDSDRREELVSLYAEKRSTKISVAARAVRKPLYYGAMLVKAGYADVMVAGAANATRKVIEAAQLCIGLSSGISTPSSFFLMEFDDRAPMVFADCAVNVDPSVVELADIAITTGVSAARLLEATPRVALLSFSTKGSASHAKVEKVRQALSRVRDKVPDMLVDGELQADSALVPEIASTKILAGGEVAGQANVLIFPDLDSGNISYKLVQQLAGARAIGPILQGFELPVADLSRGVSVSEIVATAIVALAMIG